MGWMSAHGPCWTCGRLISFSPTRVPSVVVDGVREPLCAICVERANVLRAEAGQELIVPLPGAWDPDEVAD
jgi:hypothetical protein